jgi:hypothetical protein
MLWGFELATSWSSASILTHTQKIVLFPGVQKGQRYPSQVYIWIHIVLFATLWVSWDNFLPIILNIRYAHQCTLLGGANVLMGVISIFGAVVNYLCSCANNRQWNCVVVQVLDCYDDENLLWYQLFWELCQVLVWTHFQPAGNAQCLK